MRDSDKGKGRRGRSLAPRPRPPSVARSQNDSTTSSLQNKVGSLIATYFSCHSSIHYIFFSILQILTPLPPPPTPRQK